MPLGLGITASFGTPMENADQRKPVQDQMRIIQQDLYPRGNLFRRTVAPFSCAHFKRDQMLFPASLAVDASRLSIPATKMHGQWDRACG
ncbi:hypothetical protein LP421_12600 [Rhizobium sp. RCAM05350]|nr:hypothetical protein LP421_12600 [Rhizobium sp. RCAM05350]